MLLTVCKRVGWENIPVWHQGILLPSEHDANVGGMVLGRVEVCVVTWGKEDGIINQ